MFEFLTGLATGYLLSWPALIIMLVLGVLFEYNESRGFAVFTGLAAMVTSYFFFAIPASTIAYYAVGYVVVGVVWSFWRYRRFVQAKVTEIKESSYKSADSKRYAEDLHPSKHLDTITAWILIWPFSAIESVAGDVINFIQTLVQKVFKGVYYKIYTSLTSDLIK
jgi:hypothetical protein